MIYIVEDDESIRKLIVYALETQGFSAESFGNAELFWKAVEKKQPRLVLLDIMLPGEDGLSVLRRIRSRFGSLPVIMLTAKSAEYDKVEGLDAGADDYITKPFGIMELTARIRAVLRRSEKDAAGRREDYESGGLRVRWDGHEVYVGGEEVMLTCKEYELLSLFLENQGITLTRELLLEKVWGEGIDRENRTLDVHIRTLRAKLMQAGSRIQTVRGVGYKYIGEDS